MKVFKKILSLALVLTMLATCAVSGLVTVSAEDIAGSTTETVVNWVFPKTG